MTRRAAALAAGILIGAGLLAYGGALACPFIFDDFPAIVDNPTIRHLWPLREVLATASAPLSGVRGRPLLNLSFALNYAIGGLDVRGYHAVNIAIHILAALTLFGVLRRTFASGFWAFAVALLWEVHPLQTEAVMCVVHRSESLMGLFYLLTLYGFIRSTEDESLAPSAPGEVAVDLRATEIPPAGPFAVARRSTATWAVLSVLACLLGMATKEVMATAPLLVFLYDRIFVAGSFTEAWRRRRNYYLGLAATWLFLAYLVLGEGGSRGHAIGSNLDVTPISYAVTQAWAIAHYLRLAIWPHPLVFDYGAALVGLDRAWPALLVVGSLVVAAAWALAHVCWGSGTRKRFGSCLGDCPETLARSATGIRSGSRKAFVLCAALAFAGAWFFGILAPSSSVVPLAAQTIAEHRMYLPLAAVIAVAVWGVSEVGRPGPPCHYWKIAVFVLCALALSLATVRRNRDYRSDQAIWAETVAARPDNSRAWQHLGLALGALGRTNEAMVRYREALRLKPDDAESHYDLGEALAREGRIGEALAEYRSALRFRPGFAEAHNNLGSLLGNQGRLAEAEAEFAEAVRLKPDYIEAQRNQALARQALRAADRP